MNWLVISVVGAAAVWFEYNYRRSRRQKTNSGADASTQSTLTVPETAHVAEVGAAPSISPGSENDKKLNTTA
jgi:hypothetical protein